MIILNLSCHDKNAPLAMRFLEGCIGNLKYTIYALFGTIAVGKSQKNCFDFYFGKVYFLI
jgi:hypothetical protein